MANIVLLSHILNENTPAYGGGVSLTATATKAIAKGDTANTSDWMLPNHLGTHLDVPRHFFDDGKSLTDYEPATWFFNHPQIIAVNVAPGQLIGLDELDAQIDSETDFLMLRTGFGQYRDDERYWKESPGIKSTLGHFLRQEFPNVRMLGFDFISMTSKQHRDEGKLAHRAFLDPAGEGDPILILEDMDLANATRPFDSVIVAPLMVEEADGSPCTVFGFY